MTNTAPNQPIRILHLSDLHFDTERKWDSDPVLRGLTDRLKTLKEEGLSPDVIAITGDNASAGEPDDYQEADEWVGGRLLPAIGEGFPKDRVLLVPGNHDVRRAEVNFTCQATQSKLLASKSQDLIADVLRDPSQCDFLLKRHNAYMDFARQYGPHGENLVLPWWSASLGVKGSKVHFGGLCSSWMSWSDQDRGQLLLGRWQVHEVLRGADVADWSIALVHHPSSYLAEFDAEEVERKIHHECHLVLRGHRHRQEAYALTYPDDTCLELTAGCCYDGSRYPNAFQLIELNGAEGLVHVHFWLWDGSKWIRDRNACSAAADGVARFVFPLTRAKPKAETPSPEERTPPSEDEVFRLFDLIQGEWDLTFGRGGTGRERCSIDGRGRFFTIRSRPGMTAARPKFTLKPVHLDMRGGVVEWEKVGPEGDVFHTERLTFSPGESIDLLNGHKVGEEQHVIRYRRSGA